MYNSHHTSTSKSKNSKDFNKIIWIAQHKNKKQLTSKDTYPLKNISNNTNINNSSGNKNVYHQLNRQASNTKLITGTKHRRTATDKIKQTDEKKQTVKSKYNENLFLKQLIPTLQKYINYMIDQKIQIMHQKLLQKIQKLTLNFNKLSFDCHEIFQENQKRNNRIIKKDMQNALQTQLTQRYVELEDKSILIAGQVNKIKYLIKNKNLQKKQNIILNHDKQQNYQHNEKCMNNLLVAEIVKTYNHNFKEIFTKICFIENILSKFLELPNWSVQKFPQNSQNIPR